MFKQSWLKWLGKSLQPVRQGRRGGQRCSSIFLPGIECLEERCTPTQISLTSVADNTLYEETSQSSQLSNGAGQHFYAGDTDQATSIYIRRGVLRFDLSSVPVGSTITNATLTLHLSKTAGGAGAQNIALHLLLQAWGEGTSNAGTGGDGSGEGDGVAATANDATWLDTFYDPTNPQFWTTPGGTFSSTVSATTSVNGIGNYSWNASGLTADVQTWVNQPGTNFGWIVIGNETTNRTAKQFDTRENTTASHRPTLVVTYTAPPTVTSVNPSTGPAAGGTSVIVTGTGFTGATAVHFGATAATSFTVNSDTQITAIDPAGSGVVDVTVTIPVGGTSATSAADQFTYVGSAPAISSVVINQDITALYNAPGQPFAGAQRSMVNDIVYTFTEPVNILDPGTDPNVFSVAVASGWTGTVPTLGWAPIAGSGDTEWAVAFSGTGVTGSSIANGAYTITVTDPGSITAESDGQALTVTPGVAPGTGNPGYATQQFYRLFGDINGDEFVNAADNVKFKQALTTYNAAFDYSQDGFVNASDNVKFKNDLTVNFSGFMPTI